MAVVPTSSLGAGSPSLFVAATLLCNRASFNFSLAYEKEKHGREKVMKGRRESYAGRMEGHEEIRTHFSTFTSQLSLVFLIIW